MFPLHDAEHRYDNLDAAATVEDYFLSSLFTP